MSLIKAEKISYTYPVREDDEFDAGAKEKTQEPASEPDKAISDVSLEIEAGQFVCILGRNGSGKSTFARHLNALIVPDEGTLWIDGMNSRDQEKIWQIRSMVGMVFQNPDNQIVASVVEEDVAFGPENIGMPTDVMRERISSSLEAVHMGEYAKASPNSLSGGQKQRIAVAGILAMQPKSIVLDESTSMLDPRGRAEVMSTVKRLNREQGITVISITHYMDEALDADKIFVMDKGSVIMEGTPKEIFMRPEEIEKAGLRLPEICSLASRLYRSGCGVAKGIFSREELKEAILKLKDEHKA